MAPRVLGQSTGAESRRKIFWCLHGERTHDSSISIRNCAQIRNGAAVVKLSGLLVLLPVLSSFHFLLAFAH